MADIDVKIGITTTGDASGVKAVDDAIKTAGQSAQAVADATVKSQQQSAEQIKAAAEAARQAAEEAKKAAENLKDAGDAGRGLQETDGAIKSLLDAVSGFSRADARGLIMGFTTSLRAMSSGDISQGIASVSRGLFSMANAIPNPAIAVAASVALASLAAVWKSFAADAKKSAQEDLNDLGETFDEEMARMEEWANVKLEWAGIKNANQNIIKDFSSVVDAAAATQKAIEMIFSAKIGSQIAGLQIEQTGAAQAGDKGKAGESARQIEQLRQYEELVKLNYSIVEEKAKLEEMKLRIGEQALAAQKMAQEVEASKNQLIELKAVIRETFGAGALRTDSTAYKDMLRSTQMQADAAGQQAARYAGYPMFENLRAAEQAKEDFFRSFNAKLIGLADQAALVKEQEQSLAAAREASNEAAQKSAQEYTLLKAQIEALESKLIDLSTAAGPDMAGRAAEQAANMVKQSNEILESMETLLVEDAEKIIAAGEAAFQGAQEAAGKLDAARTAYEESASSMTEAIEKVGNAAEGIGDESAAAGEKFQAAAQEFRANLGVAASNFSQASANLNSTAISIGRQAADLAATQLQFATEVAMLKAQTAAALANSSLALSQIRNMG